MLAPSSTLAKGVISVGQRSRAIGTRKLASTRLASSSASVPSSTAESVVKVASNLKTLADVEDLVLTYGLTNGAGHGGSLRALGSAGEAGTVRPLCVVKVGGEVVSTPSMRNDLVASLRFMRDFGLLPVVVHGGGPQLNDELKKAGVEPQYVGGKSQVHAHNRWLLVSSRYCSWALAFLVCRCVRMDACYIYHGPLCLFTAYVCSSA